MTVTSRLAIASIAMLAVAATAIGFAVTKDDRRADDRQHEVPPGWTMDDMMAYAQAGTPGPMHDFLHKSVGTWHAETTMWMAPDSDPIVAPGKSTVTPLMGGRFFQVEMAGEMPGMGTYQGMGIFGYDNVTEEFQSIWFDNHSTSMMRGTGKLADDRATIEWEYTYSCAIRKEPAIMREIERIVDENTKTLEMHGKHPRTGEEFKMMEIKFTRRQE